MSLYSPDYIMEFCQLDYGIGVIDPEEYFNESSAVALYEEVKKTTAGATKGNVLQKIIEVIKKVGKWIQAQVQRIIDWFTKRNQKQKKTVSANQILTGVIGVSAVGVAAGVAIKKLAGRKDVKVNNGDENKVPSAVFTIPTQPENGLEKINGQAAAKVEPPTNPAETKQPDQPAAAAPAEPAATGEAPAATAPTTPETPEPAPAAPAAAPAAPAPDPAPIINETVELEYADIIMSITGSSEVIGLQDVNPGKKKASYDGLAAISNPETMDLLLALTNLIKDPNSQVVDIMKAHTAFEGKFSQAKFDANMQFKMTEFQAFSQKFNECMTVFDAINAGAEDARFSDQNFVNVLNSMASIMMTIQKGIHNLTRCFITQYNIDGRLVGTITTIEQMDKFVNEMISFGIPAKYIKSNAYLAAGPQLIAPGAVRRDNRNQMVVDMADGRGEMRIAINSKGKVINTTNLTLSKAFGTLMVQNMGTSPNSNVTVWEKVESWGAAKKRLGVTSAGGYKEKIEAFANSLQNAMVQNKIRTNVLSDLTLANAGGTVGVRGTELVYKGLSGQEMGVNYNAVTTPQPAPAPAPAQQ